MDLETQRYLNEQAEKAAVLWTAAYDPQVVRNFQEEPRTLRECIAANLTGENAVKPLIRYWDVVVSRGEVNEQACRFGNALLDAGMRKGQRMSIVMANRPEIVVSFTTCYKTGFVAAAYNQRCTRAEIAQSVSGVCSSTLVLEKATVAKVMPSIQAGELPSLKLVVVVDWDGESALYTPEERASFIHDGEDIEDCELTAPGMPRFVGWEGFLAAGSSDEPDVDVQLDDPAILLFTGGTTGVPKGCCQTQGRMARELRLMHHWCESALADDDPSFLVCMPMTHIMGISYGINWQLVNGGSVCLAEGSRPRQMIEAFKQFRPTVWAALPTLLHSMSLEPDLTETPYKDLDLVVFGGSFIAKETLDTMRKATNASFVESYGMSESFGFVTCNPVQSMGKVGSIGLPISDTDVLVVDAETGTRVCEPGERGEIIFRGPQTLREYWYNPAETEHAIRSGWVFSGDIGFADQDGFLYLVDRKKDTIVVSGFNVFPAEIDHMLMSHPAVIDACTVGVPDAHSGERPKSYVVLAADADVSPEELIAYCKEYLVAYKAPKYVEAIDAIPRTRNRKPDRNLLRERARQEFEKR